MAVKAVDAQMREILEAVREDVNNATETALTTVPKEAVAKLRAASPKGKGTRHAGRYARGWRVKSQGKLSAVVHNATDYQLTHLLEKGHVVRNKSGTYDRARAISHIAPVEEWAQEQFPIRILRGLKS
jgi:hypothetical protein